MKGLPVEVMEVERATSSNEGSEGATPRSEESERGYL